MTRMGGKRLAADQRGDVLVGFILIVGLLFGLFFAGVGFFLLFSWLQLAEMATQAGVRTAVVSTPAVAVSSWPNDFKSDDACTDVECLFIPAKDKGTVGRSCSANPGACETLPTLTCTGTACTGAGYAHIAKRMQQIFPVIKDENIRITYADSGLGYVGGPPVPLVTVEVVNLPILVIGPTVDLAFRLLGGEARAHQCKTVDKKNPALCPIQASMTAEDLNTAGAP